MTLSNCAGCKLVSYCSRTCQKNHWPTHKPSCRKTDAFAAVDRVLIKGLVSRRDMNGTVVEIVRIGSSSTNEAVAVAEPGAVEATDAGDDARQASSKVRWIFRMIGGDMEQR